MINQKDLETLLRQIKPRIIGWTHIAAGAGLMQDAQGLSLGEPGELSVSSRSYLKGSLHEHSIITSSDPGVSASILATDATGALAVNSLNVVAGLRVGDAVAGTDDDIRAVGDIAAGGGLYVGDVAGEPSAGVIASTGDARFAGGLAVGSSTLNVNTSDANILGGLRVGDATAATDDDVRVVGDIAVGGGIYVGNVANDSAWGSIITTSNASIGGGLRVGDTSSATDNDIRAVEDICAGGGLVAGDVDAAVGTGDLIATNNGIIQAGLRVGDLGTPTTDDIRATVDIVAGGGLYAGAVGGEPATGDVHYTANLVSRKNAQDHDVYSYHPMTAAEGYIVGWAGNGAGKSDTGFTKIDVSEASGFSFPVATAGIKAYVVNVSLRDSGSHTISAYVTLAPTAASTYGTVVGADGRTNDDFERCQRVVHADSNGDFYYAIEASGTGTLDLYMSIAGYYI